MELFLGFLLRRLGQFVEDVPRLVNPASLMSCLSKDFRESFPEAQGAITYGESVSALRPAQSSTARTPPQRPMISTTPTGFAQGTMDKPTSSS